jgi:hypothetical protein
MADVNVTSCPEVGHRGHPGGLLSTTSAFFVDNLNSCPERRELDELEQKMCMLATS